MNLNSPQDLPEKITAALERSRQLRAEGKLELAVSELEAELSSAERSGLAQYKGRISLAVAIAESYVKLGHPQKAMQALATEATVAKTTFAEIKAGAAEDEKRVAFQGLIQLRDFHTQVGLIGRRAPEIKVNEWVVGPATSLADLLGKVAVLEFWATWCRPCEQMFPKLVELHEANKAQGLEVMALTRFFMAYGGPEEAQSQELSLIRSFIERHNVEFRVGVSEDEQTQTTFGATGLPIIALIDRQGVVRHITVSTEDEKFQATLTECLSE